MLHLNLKIHKGSPFYLGTLPYGIVKREINSMDDCFDDMQEPLYGFRHGLLYIWTELLYI